MEPKVRKIAMVVNRVKMEEEDDDNDNGTPGSNSKSTRVDSVDHLVGATIYIDTGVFKGQSGTLVDRRGKFSF